VPKKNTRRVPQVYHLSYPAGVSINDFIDLDLCTVQYTIFDEAVHLVQDLTVICLNLTLSAHIDLFLLDTRTLSY
jgi:hypothetical protein